MNPIIKGQIHYGEKYVKVGKEGRYDLNAIDSKTKYILAHLYVQARTFENCVEFLMQIKRTCYDQILEIYRKEKCKPVKKRKRVTFVSDKFGLYKAAFNKLFFRVAKLQFGVPIACKKYGLEHNNNPIERYNGDINDRTKTMRGFGSDEGAEAFLDLRPIIHNFVNPHMRLDGRTPAEKAEIDIRLGRRKLLNLIRYVAQKVPNS
ncbi:MAG: DDE-type integrase/transposase/recombinase [Euryarchaeota archaeon]|nr:DDE-type integrase/transposase/recombinase [Euryarchaeota archaeon]